MLISIPLGTLIYKIDPNGTKTLLDECNEESKRILVSRGGKGGRGNRSLRTNNHDHEKGDEGEEIQIELDMNTIADIGLVGQPNAGKSSFLACVSRSSPKIAAYPFTTLSPNLGTIDLNNGNSISIADIPGLIEGAHQNVGLGHEFLKHVKKSRHLILIIDLSASDPTFDARSVLRELELYQKGLSKKIILIIANKIDKLTDSIGMIEKLEAGFPEINILPLSAKYGKGLNNIMTFITSFINKLNT